MLVISFYTKNTIYEKEIEDLDLSCKALQIDHYFEARDDLGSWAKNTCQKPLFILECLKKFQKPLLWVDADALILKKPCLRFEACDLAIYKAGTKEVRSGTMYFSPTQASLDFLELWHQMCQERISDNRLIGGDQNVLIPLFKKCPIALKIAELPLGYIKIFDLDQLPLEETVILHFQASRTALMAPFFWKGLTGRDLKAMRMEVSANRGLVPNSLLN